MTFAMVVVAGDTNLPFVISVVAIFDPVAAKAETADEGHWWRDSDSDSNWWRLRWKDDRALENWDTSIA